MRNHLIETKLAASIMGQDLKRRLAEQEELKKPEKSLKELLWKFFEENPKPTDDEVHRFAEEQGKDPHELESEVYALLGDFVNGTIFKHSDDPDEKFDEKELAMGIKTEKEHVDSEAIAKAVAKAHLAELPDYYSRLKKMEK